MGSWADGAYLYKIRKSASGIDDFFISNGKSWGGFASLAAGTILFAGYYLTSDIYFAIAAFAAISAAFLLWKNMAKAFSSALRMMHHNSPLDFFVKTGLYGLALYITTQLLPTAILGAGSGRISVALPYFAVGVFMYLLFSLLKEPNIDLIDDKDLFVDYVADLFSEWSVGSIDDIYVFWNMLSRKQKLVIADKLADGQTLTEGGEKKAKEALKKLINK